MCAPKEKCMFYNHDNKLRTFRCKLEYTKNQTGSRGISTSNSILIDLIKIAENFLLLSLVILGSNRAVSLLLL